MEAAVVGCWLALIVSVFAMSTGGIWFTLLRQTPPILRVCWRLTATSLLQLPPMLYQIAALYRCPSTGAAAAPELLRRWLRVCPLLFFGGVILAMHFALWSWSLDHTTLAQALLFISTGPFLIVARLLLCWLFYRLVRAALARRTRSLSYQRLDVELRPMAAADNSQLTDSGSAAVADSGSGTTPDDSNVDDDKVVVDELSDDDKIVVDELSDDDKAVVDELSDEVVVDDQAAADDWQPPTICWMKVQRCLPPTLLEVVGTAVGTASAVLLVLGAAEAASDGDSAEPAPSAAGDLAAVLGAAMFVWYIEIGAELRQWLPLFMYALPVTLSAAVVSGVLSLALEQGVDAADLFGWTATQRLALLVGGAAVVAGICGHTFLNLSLLHVRPLIASVVCLGEPIAGSLIGWAIGVAGPPGLATALAGAVLLVGAAITTIGDRRTGYSARCTAWLAARLPPSLR